MDETTVEDPKRKRDRAKARKEAKAAADEAGVDVEDSADELAEADDEP